MNKHVTHRLLFFSGNLIYEDHAIRVIHTHITSDESSNHTIKFETETDQKEMESTECESQLEQAIMMTRIYEFIRAQTEFILNLPSKLIS